MFAMTEQFSEAQKTHRTNLDAQLSMFNLLATTALDGVEQIVTLNLALAKASFDASASTAQQLCSASTPQEFLAQARPNFGPLQAYGHDLANLSRSTQHAFIKTTQIPAQQTMAAGSDLPGSAVTPAAYTVADAPAKQLVLPVADSVTPDTPAPDTNTLRAASAVPEQAPAKPTVMEAAVTPVGPAASSKMLASKAIHAKQGEEAAAGKTAAAAQAAKLPARSSQPRLQGRKIPGKK